MKTVSVFLAILLVGCGAVETSHGADESDQIREKFYADQHRLMESHRAILIKSGHMSEDFAEIEYYLGTFDWHTGSHGYFGAYSFSQEAFEQSTKAWFG